MQIRHLANFTAAACLGAIVHAGQAAAETASIYQSTLAETSMKTKEVSTEEVRRILVDGSAILVDSRSRAEYEAGHIPGAVNVDAAPSEQVAAVSRIVSGDKTRALVLYCNGPFCQASRRLADQLADNGFTNVRRYQLGIPVWRALGGPTELGIEGIKRVYRTDQTAVFFDARSAGDYARGSLAGAKGAPVDDLVSGKLKKIDLPEDDFNRRVILFGRDGKQARQLAEVLSKRPWHNVLYFGGTYADLVAGLK